MILDSVGIQKILPHRYPFLLVDSILEIDRLKRIVGLKSVSINESYFQGHFPGKPVMPGVLIIEGMAQTGGFCSCWKFPTARKSFCISPPWTKRVSAARWCPGISCAWK